MALQRRARAATEYAKIGGTGHMTADVSRRVVGLPPLRGPTVNPVPVRGPDGGDRPTRPQRGSQADRCPPSLERPRVEGSTREG